MTVKNDATAELLCPEDPLIGAEVQRVSLETSGVYIHFETSTVMLYGRIEVMCTGHPAGAITPNLKQGDVALLWALVGTHVAAIRLGDTVRFEFDEGTTLLLPPGEWRGEIISTFPDRTAGWDEL